MNSTNTNPDKKFLFILGGITLAGFLIRLHGSGTESITADEADTLFRIKSSRSVHELLDVWVRHDGHPPFIHLLEYFWTKIFGISEAAVRFPFILMGAGAIWFAGKISRLWFGTGTAIAVAACVAFLQFPVMYSQLARPYAPGFFFCMMLTWYWSKWFFTNEKRKSDLILFVVAGFGAAYSHYFSLLFAGLIGLCGFFFLKKENWKPYFIAGISIVILFLPYAGIFLYQLGVGGVGGAGGWLGKPTPSFFGDHLWFIFDESRPVIILAFAVSILGIALTRSRFTKFHVLALFLFLAPLLIGYFYSQKSPVLQNSVLLFSFPFLLMFMFAWIPPIEKWKYSVLIPGTFAVVLFGYVTIYKPFHLTDHFGRLRELVQTAVDMQDKYSKNAVDVYFNVDVPYFLEYNQLSVGNYPQNILGTHNNGNEELSEFRSAVENSDADFFVYGWSTVYSPLEILPIIREKFPNLIERKEWFNSAVYVFCKYDKSPNIDEKKDILFESVDLFEPSSAYTVTVLDSTKKNAPEAKWSQPCKIQLQDSSVLEKIKEMPTAIYTYCWHPLPQLKYVVQLDSTCIYSPLLKMKVGDIIRNPDNDILFSTRIKMLDSTSTIILVAEFFRDGKQLYWNGRESYGQIDHNDWRQWQNVYFGLQLPKDLLLTDTVNFYCYSKNGKPALIDNLDVKILKGHQGIYGPRKDYQ
jgi:hypothetical protein